MTLLLLVGSRCPEWRIDYRKQLLLRVLGSPYQLVTLIVAAGDPLAAVAAQHQIPVQFLLPELNQPRRKVQAALGDPAFQMRLSAWLQLLRQRAPDLGICFYGDWLPPALFELPSHGFLNFHPGPLPALKGMEPDTFAILEGRASTHGTVHLITEKFDEGAIVAITPELPLRQCMTPPQVFRALTQLGVTTLMHTITAFAAGNVVYQPQDLTQATVATRQRARLEAYLDFQHDDAVMIDRRRRAFLSQDIGIRLKAKIKQQVYEVLDVETWLGHFGGTLGEWRGDYRGTGLFAGAPMMRISNGIAIVRLGYPIDSKMMSAPPPQPEVRFDRSRPSLTSLHLVRQSLEDILDASLA